MSQTQLGLGRRPSVHWSEIYLTPACTFQRWELRRTLEGGRGGRRDCWLLPGGVEVSIGPSLVAALLRPGSGPDGDE